MRAAGNSAASLAAALAAAALGSGAVLAAPPTLDGLSPSGGQAGASGLEVAAFGKLEPWPVQVWCTHPGVTLEPGEKAGVFTAAIAADAEKGPCWVRVYNAEGASEARVFVVSGLREITEDPAVDNDSPAAALDAGELPVVINGRLEKGADVDAWKVSLKQGQALHARLDGYALRSGIDPFLHLYDPRGVRVALASRHPRNLDPRLQWQAQRDGDHVVAVMAIATPPTASVAFHGAAGAAWRLTLSTGPLEASLAGVADGLPAGPDSLPPPDGAALELPVEGFGTLSEPDGAARTRFAAKKDQNLRLAAEALPYGFPTDPVLTLENAEGGVIREVDDAGGISDAEMIYKIPADGEYVCRVQDRFGRAGEEIRYRLVVEEAVPVFAATVDKSSLAGKPGDEAPLKLALVRRHGHEGALRAELEGLPPGVSAEPVEIEAKATAADLTVRLAEDAAPFSGPVRVLVTQVGEAAGPPQVAGFTYQNADARGPYLLDEIEEIWLTVLAKPEADESEKKNP